VPEGTDTSPERQYRVVEDIEVLDEELTKLLPEEPAFDDAESDDESEADLAELDTESCLAEDKVFFNCPITNSASNLLILQYSMRHSLSQEAVADLLKLLSIHCPTPNTVPSSRYRFQKQFPSLQCAVTIHYFCSFCLQEVSGKEVSICPNSTCGKSLHGFQALSSFFELSSEQQMANLLERKLTHSLVTPPYGGV
jgi:hypothetical protein